MFYLKMSKEDRRKPGWTTNVRKVSGTSSNYSYINESFKFIQCIDNLFRILVAMSE